MEELLTRNHKNIYIYIPSALGIHCLCDGRLLQLAIRAAIAGLGVLWTLDPGVLAGSKVSCTACVTNYIPASHKRLALSGSGPWPIQREFFACCVCLGLGTPNPPAGGAPGGHGSPESRCQRDTKDGKKSSPPQIEICINISSPECPDYLPLVFSSSRRSS